MFYATTLVGGGGACIITCHMRPCNDSLQLFKIECQNKESSIFCCKRIIKVLRVESARRTTQLKHHKSSSKKATMGGKSAVRSAQELNEYSGNQAPHHVWGVVGPTHSFQCTYDSPNTHNAWVKVCGPIVGNSNSTRCFMLYRIGSGVVSPSQHWRK